MSADADSADEGLHPAGDDPDWQESAYLAWRDPVAGLGGNHRIGNELNRGTANLWCGVYTDAGDRFRSNGEGLDLFRLDGHGLVAGPQRIFHDGERLRFVLDGDGCRADLEITDAGARAFANAHTFTGTSGTAGTIFSNNFHVFCRVRGAVTLDEESWKVDAPAWRDHSWGARRWDSFVSSRSFGGEHGQGADALRFRFASMVGTNGSFFRVGSLERAGERVHVASAEMRVHVDDDSVRCPAAEVRYLLEDGGDDDRAYRDHRGDDRCHCAALRLGVRRRRDGRRRVGGLGLPRDQPQCPQRAGSPRLRARRRADQRHRAGRLGSQRGRPGVRQPAEDRAAYYRQLRDTVARTFVPELTTATAIDAAGLVDRIFAEFIVEEEWGEQLSREFGREFAAVLDEEVQSDADVTPAGFHELRARAAALATAAARSGDEQEQARCRRLADIERRFLERVDELRRDVLAERVDGVDESWGTDCSISPWALTRYLRSRLSDSPEIAVSALELVPGGRSKETMIVTLTGTTELPPQVIVRKDRPVGLLQTRAADECAVLQVVHAAGVPVPEPFFADEVSPDMLGARGSDQGRQTLLVMARVPGTKAGEYFPELAAPTEHQSEIALQLADALGRLHAVPLEDLAATNLDVGATVTEESLRTAVEGMAARIDALSGPPIVAVPLARHWLLDHIDDVVPAGRLCLLQGDVGLHNLLVENGRVTALVDWEGATIGPPARELAAVWPAATALTTWSAFVDAYCAAGGKPEAAEPAAVAFYRVFIALGACMTSRTGGDLFRTGAKRDLVTAHSGLDAHFRAQRNLARALEMAFARG